MTTFFLQAERTREQAVEAMEPLASTHVEAPQVDEILAATYPIRPEPRKARRVRSPTPDDVGREMVTAPLAGADVKQHEWGLHRDRMLAQRASARELYLAECADAPAIAETAWAVVNGVADWSRFRGGSKAEAAAASALFGDRAQQRERAMSRTLAIAGVGVR